VHKEHKFRLQSFIVKTLKKEMSLSKPDLFSKINSKFGVLLTNNSSSEFEGHQDLLLDLKQEDIDKNINDLIEREFMSFDEDLGLYVYERD
jgi:hypothetical protein